MYSPSLFPSYNNPLSLPFINQGSQNFQQTLSLTNFYALHQYKQQLEMNAKIQVLAQAQLQMQALLQGNSRKQSDDSRSSQYSPLSDINAFTEKIKIENGCQSLNAIFKQEMVSPKLESPDLEAQIREMLSYFTNRFNKSNQEEIAKERTNYQSFQSLLQLFDELTKRYASASRCREDMLRSVLRKALTFLRNRLRNQSILSARAASIAMCKRYFGPKMHEMLQNVNIEDENEILAFLLPYRKNSRNRTANGRFATEIFSSEEFRKDYVFFLGKIDELFAQDNQKKIDKFVDFLAECVRHNSINKVRTFKRFPWTEDCLASAKVIAYELLNLKPQHTSSSETKLEETFPKKHFHANHNLL